MMIKNIRVYLKALYLEDLLYSAAGGFLGSLIGVYFGSLPYYLVPIMTLIGMIVSAYIIAKKRLKFENKD